MTQERGFFEKDGLYADLINYSGSADWLLESIATDETDAAVDMIHHWLELLGADFNMRIIDSSHDGCVRLVGSKAAGITNLAAFRRRTVNVNNLAASDKHFSIILPAKNRIDPDKDITWRRYPADLPGVAMDKGEVQAIADGGPNLYLLEKRANGVYAELATNLSGEYAHKVCCVIDIRGELMRNNRSAVSVLARSIVQATNFVNENPDEVAKVLTKYSPKVTLDDLYRLYATFTYTHHPTDIDLRDGIAFYAEGPRHVGVIGKATDLQCPAQHIYMNILA